MSPVDAELEGKWTAWLLEHNRRGTKALLWIVITLYPTFGVLDYLTAPKESLWLLYSTRGLVTAVTLILFWVVRTRLFDRHPNVISSSFMVLCSLGISMMTVFMGGLASPYYAGLTLAIVATGLLYVWPAPVVLTTHTLIIATFITLNLSFGNTTEPLAAVSNQFFLVSTAIIAGTGQLFAYRSQREQLENQLLVERTKQNLEHANVELQRLDRFKSEFFANITHELKTPLTMMLAPLELMTDGQLGKISEAQRSTLTSIQKSGIKLHHLIDDLLDLSRLEESKLRLRVAEHDLVEYLQGLIAQAAPLVQRKAIDLSFESNVEQCLTHCDIERMERVFVNLLSNATKFTPQGGNVKVVLTEQGGDVVVSVADSGIGFPEGVKKRIFQRFFQVDMASTRRLGGTGIGLSLAKELAELHGGTIWAEGKEGEGATVSVRLPKDREHFSPDVLDRRGARVEKPTGNRSADMGVADWQVDHDERYRLIAIDQATEQRIVERDEDEAHRPYTVLVVDDTPDVIRVIRLALHHEFRVLAAPNGKKGLELAQKHQPTLIIADLMMPEMDGIELTKRLRASPTTNGIPVVMLTARGEVEDRIKGHDVGVHAYLAKPFSTKELLSVVRGQVQEKQATADALMSQKLDSLQIIAGGLAHELKNPLNYLKNSLASIQRDADRLLSEASEEKKQQADLAKLGHRMQRMFDTAEAGISRITSTVDLAIRYSRDGYTSALQPYDAYAALRDAIDMLIPTAGFELAVSQDMQGDGQLWCIPEELNQVFANLIENALHAMPKDGSGSLQIVARDDGSTLVFTIKDNGHGIPQGDQPRIFTAFFTTKDVSRGTGLGLTIVHRVVASLGGSIKVQSQPGAGAEFTLLLPRRLPTGKAILEPPASEIAS